MYLLFGTHKLLAYASHCELLPFALRAPTRLCFLIEFSKQVLSSYVAISNLVLIRPGSHSLCSDDGHASRLLFGTDLWPCRLWPSWIFCSYTIMPSSTEEAEQHLEVSSVFPTEKSLLLSTPLIPCLGQHLDHNIHQETDARITADSFPVNL